MPPNFTPAFAEQVISQHDCGEFEDIIISVNDSLRLLKVH